MILSTFGGDLLLAHCTAFSLAGEVSARQFGSQATSCQPVSTKGTHRGCFPQQIKTEVSLAQYRIRQEVRCDGGDSTSKHLGVAKSLPSLMSHHPRQNWFLDWNCSLPVMWFQWEDDLQSLFSIILLGEASSSASFSRRGKCASSQVGSAAE